MNAVAPKPRAEFLVTTGKIARHHRERMAVIYVRQSTLQQVERHQESTRLQYGLVERALQLGWAKEQVLVIDEDLGRSGANAEGRTGFQRLVTEVSLDHVGIILGIEMSRLARASRDWYQLLEVCAVFATLLGDVDGIYDLTSYNDRLLLGLKGTMSEAELHILKQRMLEGKRAKARRGALGMRVPMGYVHAPSGEVIKDPDEQAQAVMALIFEVFERTRTLHGLLRSLVDQGVRLPCRLCSGARKGELQWRRPNRVTLSNILRHPIYAGAYAYGRRPTDPRRKVPGRPATGRTVAKPEQWEVLLKDHLPAYISWAQYKRNVHQLDNNTVQALGTARNGPALLSGILICGRCGHRMAPQYNSNGHGLRYSCLRMHVDYGEPLCQTLTGGPLDERITQLIFEALAPAGLELSLQAAAACEEQRKREHRHWQQRLERAHFEAERAGRQYDAVEPENRLVARTLERQWEEALAAELMLQQEYEAFQTHQPATLSTEERAAIERLAGDLPALWSAPTTTLAERQQIVRFLIERVLVTVVEQSEQVRVEVHWAGGHRSRFTLIRPVARVDQLSHYAELQARVKAWHEAGCSPTQIAHKLNAEGWRPPKRRDTYNAPMVRSLLTRMGRRTGTPKQQRVEGVERRGDEWTLAELTAKLDIPQPTLYSWLRKGRLNARQVPVAGGTLWLIRADGQGLARLRELRHAPRSWPKQIA
jgi:DNA invertase Pin-like site-specific DNA recombinase